MSNSAESTAASKPSGGIGGDPLGRTEVALYARPHLGRGVLDLATSVVPYLALSVLMYFALDVSYFLTLALAIPAAGFLVRTYIVFHDCGHGSFMRSRRANRWIGTICGLLVFTPFESWRHEHAVHHATAEDLDRRGVGDVKTLTVEEYRSLPWLGRLKYRLFRNPLVMFGVGPLYAMILSPRWPAAGGAPPPPPPPHPTPPIPRPRVPRAVLFG